MIKMMIKKLLKFVGKLMIESAILLWRSWWIMYWIFFSFTLYPACSRVDRGNLMLRHCVPQFLLFFLRHCVWIGWIQRQALQLVLERRNKNINKQKFITPSGDRTHNSYSHTLLSLRHDSFKDIGVNGQKNTLKESIYVCDTRRGRRRKSW